jgi:hypothetical protein
LAQGGARLGRAGAASSPVAGALAPEIRPLLNLGATSQDMVDTALVMQLRTVLDLLAGRSVPTPASADGWPRRTSAR